MKNPKHYFQTRLNPKGWDKKMENLDNAPIKEVTHKKKKYKRSKLPKNS
jgi:hypothetical protein